MNYPRQRGNKGGSGAAIVEDSSSFDLDTIILYSKSQIKDELLSGHRQARRRGKAPAGLRLRAGGSDNGTGKAAELVLPEVMFQESHCNGTQDLFCMCRLLRSTLSVAYLSSLVSSIFYLCSV